MSFPRQLTPLLRAASRWRMLLPYRAFAGFTAVHRPRRLDSPKRSS